MASSTKALFPPHMTTPPTVCSVSPRNVAQKKLPRPWLVDSSLFVLPRSLHHKVGDIFGAQFSREVNDRTHLTLLHVQDKSFTVSADGAHLCRRRRVVCAMEKS